MNRRQLLQYLTAVGVVGTAAGLGYLRWQGKTLEQSSLTDKFSAAPVVEGAPFLIVTNQAINPFGPYLGEILHTEGLNLFHFSDIKTIAQESLQQYALVLLAEGPLEANQIEILTAYVVEGGCLVAMRPGPGLASLLGVKPEESITAEGYIQINQNQPIGLGLATETLQFHGQASHYRPVEAEVIAWLYRDIVTPTGLPAVTVRRLGQGYAAMWAFDLARSVAYTRQGNPMLVGQERDGAEGIRAQETFFGWIDLNRMSIPQADEQTRLLSQLITQLVSDKLPLPRLWYFPNASPAMLIATGDSHANPVVNIEAVLPLVESYDGAMSILYTPRPRSENPLRRTAGLAVQQVKNWLDPFPTDPEELPTPAQVEQWRARGHEFSLHPYVEEGVAAGYQAYVAAFEAEGYTLPASKSVRTHRVLWDGWVETAKVQASYGFGLNFDFYQMGSLLRTEDGQWARGYFTGSGRPMKMVDEMGQIIDVYQLLTELIDEQLLKDVNSGYEGLDSQAAIDVSRQMIDNAIKYHTALVTQFHLDFYHPTSPVRAEVEAWAKGTLAYAAERGLPIWNGARFLDFVRCRDQTQLHHLAWDQVARRLTFELLAPNSGDFELTILVPAMSPIGVAEPESKTELSRQALATNEVSRLEVDGRPVEFAIHSEAGGAYAWVSVSPGPHQIEAWYGQA